MSYVELGFFQGGRGGSFGHFKGGAGRFWGGSGWFFFFHEGENVTFVFFGWHLGGVLPPAFGNF